LQALLGHPEIDLSIVDVYQRTPLHYACEKKFFFSILYLLEKWFNYDLVDYEGNTPLDICFRHQNLNQAAMILKKVGFGADAIRKIL
jgi:ankyrin repeat protein